MKTREVIPLKQGLDFTLTLPGSKSITNRALLCAALSKGKSRLFGALESDDTKVMIKALKRIGVSFRRTQETERRKQNAGNRKLYANETIEISWVGGKFTGGRRTFDLHNAGTAIRFLTAVMAVREGTTVLTGDKRMQERPIGDLVGGLRQIGVEVGYLKNNGYPPIKVKGIKLRNKDEYVVRMKGDKSSQYLSALLMLGPLLDKPLRLKVVGELVSRPYIDMTIAVMKAFGVKVKNNKYQSFVVKPQVYRATDYTIEGDASAASYWTSMVFLNKKFVQGKKMAEAKVKFTNLNKKSIQGDQTYGKMLKFLGKGEIDMNSMPDSAMTLAVTAPFAKGQTRITGLSTLRIKETDRLAALSAELKKVGVKVKTTEDSIAIQGGGALDTWKIPLKSIKTYNDHRMAMCFAVVGTVVPGIVIENPNCVDKTYPAFWEDLERMYLSKKIKLGSKNLVLTGMRGSGKSYLGKKIARLLNRKFIDLDLEVERYAKMKIKHVVKKHNWELFRKLEQEVCKKFENSKNLVIATGGGIVLDPKNMKILKKNGINVFIFCEPSVLIERMKKQSNRPALKGKNPLTELRDVWRGRRNLYLRYADFVWDNTSGEVVEGNLGELFS